MLEVSYKFLIIILIIALGYLLKRTHLLSRKEGDSLSKIAFSVTLPALIISSMNDVTLQRSYILFPILGIGIGIIMLLASFLVYKNQSKKEKGMLTMPMLGLNIGLFAIPLAQVIFGEEAVRYLILIDLGNAFVIFVMCYIIGAIYANDSEDIKIKEIAKKAFRSVPLVVYIITIAIKLLGLTYPKFVLDVASILKEANTTVSMIALGLFLSFSFEKKQLKLISKFLITKYTIGFSIGLLIYIFAPLDQIIRITIMMAFVLPSSFSVLPYSVEFGYDRKFVGAIVNSTIVVSVIFMWMIALFV